MVELELHNTYRVRVRLRRGGTWKVKPEAEELDGLELVVSCAWFIDSGQYTGEYAMMLPPAPVVPIAWVASGDVELLERVT